MSAAPDYVTLAQVLGALYAGQGLAPGDPPPTDATRDARLQFLISNTCRDFDYEVMGTKLPGVFLPKYETRTFSGRGDQELEIDPILAINSGATAQVQINTTPGYTPTWSDYTSELGSYRMGLLPADSRFPKTRIFRQSSWFADPFPLGNVQITGLWAICQVDPGGTPPTHTQGWNNLPGSVPPIWGPGISGLTDAYLAALAPPAALGGGWWTTPADVVDAIVAWIVNRFEMGKAGYSQQPGSSSMAGVQDTLYPSEIPAEVQRVIRRYRGEDEGYPRFALVSNDGEGSETPYRWAGWITR